MGWNLLVETRQASLELYGLEGISAQILLSVRRTENIIIIKK